MQDADLFLELAGIAGVFVGFGALISTRSGGPSAPDEVAPMRAVVGMGLLTVVAALAPVTLGRYGPTAHEVWALSSALVLVGIVGFVALSARTPEYRENWVTSVAATRWTPGEVLVTAAYGLYMIALVLLPMIVMLGLAPDLEAALYFSYVVLILLGAGWTLLWLVFMERRPLTASGQAVLPPAGDSGA
jgi:hypothetical protein